MRERITAAFVLLAVIVLLGAGSVRAFTLRDVLREQEAAHLRDDTALVGHLIAQQIGAERPVDEEFLRGVISPDAQLQYTDPDGEVAVVAGPEFDSGEDNITVSLSGNLGMIELTKETLLVRDIYTRDLTALLTLFLLIALAAGGAGWLAARALARPFQQLALAAGALGRGRFDLDLPRTRMPEAQAIAQSLRTSALQLEARLSRERAFAEHASHVLRTPLTVLRLELESLSLDDDVAEETRAAAARCIASVDEVNRSAGDLVKLARRGSLVEGAEVTLQELAAQLAQRWADRLSYERRSISAAAEGDLDMAFTPGPVEHVLDLVLSDVVLSGKGPVRMTFRAQDDYLKVSMPAGVISANGTTRRRRRRGPAPGAGMAEARSLAESQGGRIIGDGVEKDLEILLPRR